MTNPSNLYAEKIFSEHPVALWALDEPADYISLIDDTFRDLTKTSGSGKRWTLTGGTSQLVSDSTAPFLNSPVTRVTGSTPSGTEGVTNFTSSVVTNFNTLDSNLKTFAISTYFYSDTALVTKIEIGYQIGTATPVLQVFKPSEYQTWGFLSKTFDVPTGSNNFKIVLQVTYTKDVPGTEYSFSFNGLTVGQWIEEFSSESLGEQYVSLPSSIATSELYGIEAKAYGLQDKSGYYIVNNKSLKAKNSGVPLVYGSSGVTTLIPNNSSPSIILPGFGFMNSNGRYRELTLETWLRVNNSTSSAKRIIGPISSTDGLYVNGPFLTLKIDNFIESYPISEWGRPMLLDIRISGNAASLLINGEQVIYISLDQTKIALPEPLDASGKDQDWIGLYSYEEIAPVNVDCVAIYPYLVSEVLAKRRFAYGQAVDIPDNINSAYSSKTMMVDYSLAKYANNYNYPDIGKWQNGILDNLVVDNNAITVPNFEVPTVVFDTKTTDEWYSAIEASQSPTNNFITFKPDQSWSSVNGYMLIPKFNMTNQNVKSLFGVFTSSGSTEDQTLFKFYNNINTNYFEVYLSGNILNYKLSYNGNISIFSSEEVSNTFVAGFDIQTFAQHFGNSLSEFFGNRDQISLYVGGNRDFSNTFSGVIHKIGFNASKNHSLMSDLFDAITGLIFSGGTDDWLSHTANYTVIMKSLINKTRLDIAVTGSWQDYIPLSYFSKYIKNANNESYYSLDFIQLNISYPEPATFMGVADYARGNTGNTVNPVGRKYDTSAEMIKTFVTFQSLSSQVTQNASFYTSIQPLDQNGVVTPGSDWATTMYEVVNGTIVYPPTGVDFKTLAISVKTDFVIDGIKSNPIKIKSLQLASQAYNDIGENAIGTKYGIPVYPYTKLGIYFDYKKRNPFTIYKSSSPYLYLTKQSGIKMRGDAKIGINRGISMRMNPGLATSYTVSTIQTSIRYDEELFPINPTEVFEVEANNTFIKYYLVSTTADQKRGKIYGINTKTGKMDNSTLYYLNGKFVKDAVISLKEWYILGMEFSDKLVFGSYANGTILPTAGAFRITGPLMMNNISHYQLSAAQEGEAVNFRKWISVKNTESGTASWTQTENTYSSWEKVLYVITTSQARIDPKKVYRIYTGTNKVIAYNEKPVKFGSYQYKIYNDINWQTQTLIAV
jgi:hypothetical protein